MPETPTLETLQYHVEVGARAARLDLNEGDPLAYIIADARATEALHGGQLRLGAWWQGYAEAVRDA